MDYQQELKELAGKYEGQNCTDCGSPTEVKIEQARVECRCKNADCISRSVYLHGWHTVARIWYPNLLPAYSS